MEAISSEAERLAFDPALDRDLKSFVWHWYIRLKVTFSVNTADLPTDLASISKESEELWKSLKSSLGKEEGQPWPTPLVDTSKSYFFLIGLPTLSSPDLAKSRQFLKEWQKETSQKCKGQVTGLEAKFIPRKVFDEHGFEVYDPEKFRDGEYKWETESVMTARTKKEKKEAFPAAGNFKKIKGSNPAEVRRQFLEHNMKVSGSGSATLNADSSSSGTGKLRPGKEVLNRMKFDEGYDVEKFVVGYIDRKEGILECSVREWEALGKGGREDLMAYVKNRESEVVVWDKARKVDLVFGGKGGG